MDRKDVIVHKSLLYENEPYSVECMAVDEEQGILALARRADYGEERKRESLLEFWNVIGRPVFHLKTRRLGFGGVESLLWIKSFLISSHLDGSVHLHQLHRPDDVRVQVCPSPLWSLAAIYGNSFCAGSDSGAIFLLSLNDGKVTVDKMINIGFGVRVLSLAANAKIVAAGSIDTVSIVGLEKATILNTLKVPRSERRKPTIVWCLGILSDETLVSGDSRGCISFWNLKNGTVFQTIESHQADVLSLCIDNNFIYAAGVDPTIVRICSNQNGLTFRINHSWRQHINDVRSLVFSGGRLFSGGAQHQFFISTVADCEAAVKSPVVHYLPKKNLVLYQYAKCITVWLLGTRSEEPNKYGDYLLSNEPKKLLKVSAPSDDFIVCSAISGDGELLAISTGKYLVLYRTTLASINHDSISSNSLISVEELSKIEVLSSCMSFVGDQLYYATGSLKILKFDWSNPEVVSTIAYRENSGEALRIRVKEMDTGYHRIVILTTRNEVFYLQTDTKQLLLVDSKPLGLSPIMDVQFLNTESVILLCANSNASLYECLLDFGDGTSNGKQKQNCLVQKMPSPTLSTSKVFVLNSNDHIQSMDVAPWGICMVSVYGVVRLLISDSGKRALLHTASDVKPSPGQEKPCAVHWINETSVLLSMLNGPCETSHESFRLKRYGQN